MNTPSGKAITLTIIGSIAFLIWSVMVYYDPSLRPDYLKLIVLTVTTIVTIVLRDLPQPPPPPPSTPELPSKDKE